MSKSAPRGVGTAEMVAISIVSTEPPILNRIPAPWIQHFSNQSAPRNHLQRLLTHKYPSHSSSPWFCRRGGGAQKPADWMCFQAGDSEVGGWVHTCCPRPVSTSWGRKSQPKAVLHLHPFQKLPPQMERACWEVEPSPHPGACAFGSLRTVGPQAPGMYVVRASGG